MKTFDRPQQPSFVKPEPVPVTKAQDLSNDWNNSDWNDESGWNDNNGEDNWESF
jgi:hypothetical protein